MATKYTAEGIEVRHTEDMQHVIFDTPKWLLRRGITFIFLLLVSIVCLSAFISYPNIITGQLVLNPQDSYLISQSGKSAQVEIYFSLSDLNKIKEGQKVKIKPADYSNLNVPGTVKNIAHVSNKYGQYTCYMNFNMQNSYVKESLIRLSRMEILKVNVTTADTSILLRLSKTLFRIKPH